jgi:S-DNA-T family DNA segregation ATPase FtsK/SpoIIIE
MTARTKRADKAVLSRQEIAERRRRLSDKKKLEASGAGQRAIAGVFVLAFSIIGLLSVATFHPADRTGPGFKNAIGPAGHLIGEALLGSFGVCAFALPAAGAYGALALLIGGERRRWPQLVSFILLTLSGTVLAELAFAGDNGWAHPPGGSVGEMLTAALGGLFSTLGTVILVTAVAVAALIVGTQFVFLKLCAAAGRGTLSAVGKLSSGAVALVATLKASLAARGEAAAKAKLEEAAFLAQLEAEEEGLQEQEWEATEAEAIAEEADPLDREAMKRRSADAAAKKRGKEQKEATAPEAAPADAAPVGSPTGEPVWVNALGDAAASDPRQRRMPLIVTQNATKSAEAAGVEAAPRRSPDPDAPSALAVAPQALVARTPVIVEPRPPPRPTKKKEHGFEFVGSRRSFSLPPLELLNNERAERSALDKEVFLSTAERLRAKLADFGIVGEVVEIRPGPVVTMYEFLPGPGIKVSKIASLADDLAMAMEAMRVRIVAPIPGKGVVGIEVPNKAREMVYLKEIAEQDAFLKSSSRITMCLGKDIEGMPYVFDLAKAPHLLIAGTTGSGKSVSVNAMIMSILLKSTPEEVRFVMVDPKMLELSVYEGIPHLLLPVVTDPKKAALALRWAVEEMERRYALLAEVGVRNIGGYNKMVESSAGEGKEKSRKGTSASDRDARVTAEAKVKAPEAAPASEAASSPVAPKAAKKPKKMVIIDVAEGETEEQAVERAGQTPALGVAAPRDAPEDVREAVIGDPATAPAPLTAAGGEASAEGAAAGEVPEEKQELKKLPYIVVIIDELADLMMVASREVETYIARLAQMARAAGIHLMVATQRPSTDVVTGVIKANFPTRISFMLRTKPDSMTILGTTGAEALLGQGDMLIMPPTSAHLQRVHGAYVSEGEIGRVVDHLKAQGKPVYDESILKPRDEEGEGGLEEDDLSDELYDQALKVVSEMKQVSISMLQRKMRIGYNRAARMIERMERDGVVGPADGARPREVLIRPVGEMPGAGAM